MQIFFLFFCVLLMFCSLMVVLSNHPITSLLFLIGCFLNTGILLLMYGLDLIALIFIVIYIGAIAIFFLFVVMLLNIPAVRNAPKLLLFEYLIGILLFVFFFFNLNYLLEIFLLINLSKNFGYQNYNVFINYTDTLNIFAFFLYTNYAFIVVLSAILLLFAMLLSIILLQQAKDE